MRKTFLVTTALACLLAANAGALAQGSTGITTAAPPPSSNQSPADLTKEQLLGRDAFSQDQTLMGPVERVVTAANGQVQAIVIKTGGFLGFGARLVAIPQGKFHMRGQNVQLQLTSEEVQKLPEQKNNS